MILKPKILPIKWWNNQTDEHKKEIIEALEMAKQRGMNINFCYIHYSLTIGPYPVCLSCARNE